MPLIEIYSRPNCPFCTSAKRLLKMKGKTFTEYDVMRDQKRFSEMRTRTNNRTFPQIFIDGKNIGGFAELMSIEQ